MTAQELKPTTIAIVGATTPAGRALVMELARGELTVLDPKLHVIVENQAQERLTPEAQALKALRPVEIRLFDEKGKKGNEYTRERALEALAIQAQVVSLGAVNLTVQSASLEGLFEGADFVFFVDDKDYEDDEEEDGEAQESSWEARYLDYSKALNRDPHPTMRILVAEGFDCLARVAFLSALLTTVPRQNITALSRFSENAARLGLAQIMGLPVGAIRQVTIWGHPWIDLKSAWLCYTDEKFEHDRLAKAAMEAAWVKPTRMKPVPSRRVGDWQLTITNLWAFSNVGWDVCDAYMDSDALRVDPRYALSVATPTGFAKPFPIWSNIEVNIEGLTTGGCKKHLTQVRNNLVEALHWCIKEVTNPWCDDKVDVSRGKARAMIDHMHDWVYGAGDFFVSMVVPSNQAYGLAKDVFFSLPCRMSFKGLKDPYVGATYSIVDNLVLADRQRQELAFLSYDLQEVLAERVEKAKQKLAKTLDDDLAAALDTALGG